MQIAISLSPEAGTKLSVFGNEKVDSNSKNSNSIPKQFGVLQSVKTINSLSPEAKIKLYMFGIEKADSYFKK